jgi:hypothetical protein
MSDEASCTICRLIESFEASRVRLPEVFGLGFVSGAKAACAGVMPRLCPQHLKEIALIAEAANVRLIEVESDEQARALRAELEITAFRISSDRSKA